MTAQLKSRAILVSAAMSGCHALALPSSSFPSAIAERVSTITRAGRIRSTAISSSLTGLDSIYVAICTLLGSAWKVTSRVAISVGCSSNPASTTTPCKATPSRNDVPQVTAAAAAPASVLFPSFSRAARSVTRPRQASRGTTVSGGSRTLGSARISASVRYGERAAEFRTDETTMATSPLAAFGFQDPLGAATGCRSDERGEIGFFPAGCARAENDTRCQPAGALPSINCGSRDAKHTGGLRRAENSGEGDNVRGECVLHGAKGSFRARVPNSVSIRGIYPTVGYICRLLLALSVSFARGLSRYRSQCHAEHPVSIALWAATPAL